MWDIGEAIASGHGIEETSTRMGFSPSASLQMVRDEKRAGGMERDRETQSWKGAESSGSSIRRDGRREEVFTLNRGPLQSSLPTTQSLSLLSLLFHHELISSLHPTTRRGDCSGTTVRWWGDRVSLFWLLKTKINFLKWLFERVNVRCQWSGLLARAMVLGRGISHASPLHEVHYRQHWDGLRFSRESFEADHWIKLVIWWRMHAHSVQGDRANPFPYW